MSQSARIARFVRDTPFPAHTMQALVDRFGRFAVNNALTNGVIERQRWQGEETDFVDLTPEGEALLVEIARGPLPLIVTGR